MSDKWTSCLMKQRNWFVSLFNNFVLLMPLDKDTTLMV